MARLNFLVISLFIGLSTFFSSEVEAVSKEQQENFLVYQKTNTSIDVGLSKTQIIYPFHWFT